MPKPVFPLFLCLLTAAACSSAQKSTNAGTPPDHEVEELTQYMIGDFSSQAQHLRDSAYLDTRLHICPIWPADRYNRWLYAEQAPATTENKPSRQQVYKIERDTNGRLRSTVYLLPEPQSKWAGGYHNPTRFEQINSTDLRPSEGCTIYLSKRADGSYGGGTHGRGCESGLHGASTYTTSVVVVKKNVQRIWEQGFNDKKEQVWGSAMGGYEFIRQQ